jgi:hypothetical protein
LHLVQDEVFNATGNPTAAEQSYHPALVRQRLAELSAATSLSHLWRDQGERAEARDLLAANL